MTMLLSRNRSTIPRDSKPIERNVVKFVYIRAHQIYIAMSSDEQPPTNQPSDEFQNFETYIPS